jgi:archaellum component FlaG (FlaF/FlaG flagellin family)
VFGVWRCIDQCVAGVCCYNSHAASPLIVLVVLLMLAGGAVVAVAAAAVVVASSLNSTEQHLPSRAHDKYGNACALVAAHINIVLDTGS